MSELVGGVTDTRLYASTRRVAAALCFAGLYGAAIGARFGAAEMAAHAAGVPAALFVVGFVGTPAFYILLTHAGVVLEPGVAWALVCRALATCAVVLGGLAPASALLAVSAETPAGAALFAALGLLAAGLLGLRRLLAEVREHLVGPADRRIAGARCVVLGFAAFATVLSARLWWITLPILRGNG